MSISLVPLKPFLLLDTNFFYWLSFLSVYCCSLFQQKLWFFARTQLEPWWAIHWKIRLSIWDHGNKTFRRVGQIFYFWIFSDYRFFIFFNMSYKTIQQFLSLFCLTSASFYLATQFSIVLLTSGGSIWADFPKFVSLLSSPLTDNPSHYLISCSSLSVLAMVYYDIGFPSSSLPANPVCFHPLLVLAMYLFTSFFKVPSCARGYPPILIWIASLQVHFSFLPNM